MGQKTNPIGLRIAVNKDWRSKWYAEKKEFGQELAEFFFLGIPLRAPVFVDGDSQSDGVGFLSHTFSAAHPSGLSPVLLGRSLLGSWVWGAGRDARPAH